MMKEEVFNYLNKIPSFAKKTPLCNVQLMLDYLGNPERNLVLVHVAGTNGKGSSCAFLENILRCGGKKTGLFTSPHILDMKERVQINKSNVSDHAIEEAFYQVKRTYEQHKQQLNHPTFFEFFFYMALLIFKKERIDVGIIETGMGGRNDATNAILPKVVILTTIDIDHTEFLGTTLSQIAYEKAGIIKPGIPVITGKQKSEVYDVIQREATLNDAPFQVVSEDNLIFSKSISESIDFSKKYEYDKKERIKLGLFGSFQYENAALAIKAARKIDESLSDSCILEGITTAKIAGRMEQVEEGIFVDGGHNEQAINRFVDTVNENFSGPKVVLFAPSHRMQEEQMTEQLQKLEHVIAIKKIAVNQREIDDDAFCRVYQQLRRYRDEGAICFCIGSFYLVGKVKEFLEEDR